MDLKKVRTAATLSGFSKLLGAPSRDFILFDDDTDGRCGRPIFINSALINKLGNIENFKELEYSFLKIKQLLSSTAGGITSHSNLNDAMEHSHAVGRAKITYKVVPAPNDPGRKPGVYITDLGLSTFSGSEPGIYTVKEKDGRWKVDKEVRDSIGSKCVAINGLCYGMVHAAEHVMPDMVEKAYGDQKQYDLFYCPPYLYDDNGAMWKTPEQKAFSQEVTTRLLKQALLDSQRARGIEAVNWAMNDIGVKLMREALVSTGEADLSKHTLAFMGTEEVVADVLPLVRRRKMKLHKDVMFINDDDLEAKRAQWGSGKKEKLAKELTLHAREQMSAGNLTSKQANKFVDRGKELQKKLLKDQKNSWSETYVAGNLSKAVGAALVGPVAVTAAGIASVAMQILKTDDRLHSFRNRIYAATNSRDHHLNPRLNPHKSVELLNDSAVKASGGSLTKSFVAVVKHYLKG